MILQKQQLETGVLLCIFILAVHKLQATHGWTVLQQSLPSRSREESSSQCLIGLQMEPLIGGPNWLKLHVKVVLQFHNDDKKGRGGIMRTTRSHKFDFVPQNATNADTMRRLVQLQSVPADLRYFAPPRNVDTERPFLGTIHVQSTSSKSGLLKEEERPVVSQHASEQRLINEARLFCESYPSKDLNLITNNCWTFAFRLYSHIILKSFSST